MPRTDSNTTVEKTEFSLRRRQRDSGAMLLAVLFMMAIMVIVAMAMAPAFVQQAKRDREEEMIHRGTEYARAVKKYYKKFGRYPSNLEQLDNTNQIRFLRKRFKDPLTKDGQWKLLHYGDIQTITGGAMPGIPTAGAGAQGLGGQGALGAAGNSQLANTAPAGAQLSPLQQLGAASGIQSAGGLQSGGGASPLGGPPGSEAAAAAAAAAYFSTGSGGTPASNMLAAQAQAQAQNTPGQTGSNNTIFGNSGVGGQTFGGGAIVGVASMDKETTIRLFNQKKTYDQWMFIYNPAMDRLNGLLRGPYNGQSSGGSQIGTPAGQMNQGSQGAFGQQPGGTAQQPGGFGQQTPQQNQPANPGNQYPPDQNQPQQ
jgi:type II secretory pathway pseudopilin PulG